MAGSARARPARTAASGPVPTETQRRNGDEEAGGHAGRTHRRERRHARRPGRAGAVVRRGRAGPEVVGRHRRVARRRRRAHPRRDPALGAAVAEGVGGAGDPRPAPPPRLVLHGRPVRLQRPAHDHRWRRAPGESAVPRHRRVAGDLRLGGARAPHRLARAATDHVGRVRGQPRPPAPRLGDAGGVDAGVRHPGAAGRRARRRRQPAHRRPVRRPAPAGVASPAPSTWASTGCAPTPVPPSTSSSPGSRTSSCWCSRPSPPPTPSASGPPA